MANIQSLTKSRRGKAYCSKCGQEIMPGDRYKKATPFRREPIIRCIYCGLQPYETSGSKYIRTVGDLVYTWKEKYHINESVIDNILSAIENIRDDLQFNLDEMPEQFQYDNILQDRIDNLDDCISELEAIDTQDCDKSDIITNIDAALSHIQMR